MTPEEMAEVMYNSSHRFSGDCVRTSRDVIIQVIRSAVRDAVLEEREACAKLAEELEATYEIREDDPVHGPGTVCSYHEFAAAIRSRGQKR